MFTHNRVQKALMYIAIATEELQRASAAQPQNKKITKAIEQLNRLYDRLERGRY